MANNKRNTLTGVDGAIAVFDPAEDLYLDGNSVVTIISDTFMGTYSTLKWKLFDASLVDAIGAFMALKNGENPEKYVSNQVSDKMITDAERYYNKPISELADDNSGYPIFRFGEDQNLDGLKKASEFTRYFAEAVEKVESLHNDNEKITKKKIAEVLRNLEDEFREKDKKEFERIDNEIYEKDFHAALETCTKEELENFKENFRFLFVENEKENSLAITSKAKDWCLNMGQFAVDLFSPHVGSCKSLEAATSLSFIPFLDCRNISDCLNFFPPQDVSVIHYSNLEDQSKNITEFVPNELIRLIEEKAKDKLEQAQEADKAKKEWQGLSIKEKKAFLLDEMLASSYAYSPNTDIAYTAFEDCNVLETVGQIRITEANKVDVKYSDLTDVKPDDDELFETRVFGKMDIALGTTGAADRLTLKNVRFIETIDEFGEKELKLIPPSSEKTLLIKDDVTGKIEEKNVTSWDFTINDQLMYDVEAKLCNNANSSVPKVGDHFTFIMNNSPYDCNLVTITPSYEDDTLARVTLSSDYGFSLRDVPLKATNKGVKLDFDDIECLVNPNEERFSEMANKAYAHISNDKAFTTLEKLSFEVTKDELNGKQEDKARMASKTTGNGRR